MNIAFLGIDLGKNLCSVVGVDETGAVVLRRRMRHQTIVQYASGLPGCVMARRRAAARTISDVFSGRRATRSD